MRPYSTKQMLQLSVPTVRMVVDSCRPRSVSPAVLRFNCCLPLAKQGQSLGIFYRRWQVSPVKLADILAESNLIVIFLLVGVITISVANIRPDVVDEYVRLQMADGINLNPACFR